MGLLDAAAKAVVAATQPFGKEVTLWPGEQRKYDTATRKVLGPYADPITVNAVVSEATGYGSQIGSGTGGTAQGATGAKVGVYKLENISAVGLPSVPTTDWEVGLGDVDGDGTERRHAIVRVEPLYGTDDVVAYTLWARR